MKHIRLLSLALLLLPAQALSLDLGLSLEPAAAIPLSAPQSTIYKTGGAMSLKLLFGVLPFLDISTGVGVVGLPARAEGGATGAEWLAGAGLRLKRPHDAVSLSGLSPWLEADFLYVRTGPLNRPAVDVGAGVNLPLDEARNVWLGPFVRFVQTISGARNQYDDRDARILLVGLTLELKGQAGARREAEVEAAPHTCPTCPACPAAAVCPPAPKALPDRDGDTVPDRFDRCPDAPGPVDNQGCPIYNKIVVKEDRLELKEKIYFAWDQAVIEKESYPLLDEVVVALKDNKGFVVQVDGHADSSGADDHNQTLSEARANAVVDYLVDHGVPKSRLQAKGFSSSAPRDTNATAEGRENNRRVEFVVQFSIIKKEGDK
jgi:outer membrane protein OmpA-like peptidoglycan-associated protein